MGLTAIAWGMFTAITVQAASFQISPTRFEFSLNKRFTNFFTLTNLSESSLRVRVYARFIEVSENNKLVEKVGHPHDLSRWMVFNPRQLTIRAKQKRTIRFSVRSPRDLEDGEYRGVIFFEQLPTRTVSDPTDLSKKTLQLKLTLKTRVGVTLYGMKGEPKTDLAFEHIRVSAGAKGVRISNSIENKGNVHVSLKLNAHLVSEAGGKTELPDSTIVIQRGDKRKWDIQAARLSPGQYRLVVAGTAKKIKVLDLEIPIEVGAR